VNNSGFRNSAGALRLGGCPALAKIARPPHGFNLKNARALLPWRKSTALISRMGTKTTFICDCCLREADNNLGWARIHISGDSGDKQLMPEENRDLCEICWSPLQTLMNKVHDDARARRNS